MAKKKETGFSEAVIDTYRNGTEEQRDALRVVANTVMNPAMCFKYKKSPVPSLAQATAVLGTGEFRIPFSGEQAQIAPDDMACSLDSLLKPEYANSFAGLLENIAVTLVYTATENFRANKQPDVWTRSTNHNAELIRRAFAYWVAQEGLSKLLKNPEPIWHTKLPVFFISVFEKESDCTDGVVLSYSLVNMFTDQTLDEHQFAVKRNSPKSASIDLDSLDEDELRRMVVKENLASSTSARHIEPDELYEMLDIHFNRDEDEDDDMSYFDPDVTLLSIKTELPLVIEETISGNRSKGSSNRLDYTDVPCVWHPLTDKEDETTFWSISLVSRSTTSISTHTATTTEALKIAAAISAFES